MIVEGDILDADWLPPKFYTLPSPWQERAIVTIWSALLIGYLLAMAPILVVSLVFWLAAMEWSMESMFWFSSAESLDSDNDDDDEHDHDEQRDEADKKPNEKENAASAAASDRDAAPPLINADLHEWN